MEYNYTYIPQSNQFKYLTFNIYRRVDIDLPIISKYGINSSDDIYPIRLCGNDFSDVYI